MRINALSMGAELLYRRLMSVADDHGRFYGAAATVRGACWPINPHTIRDEDIGNWLIECCRGERPLISMYQHEGVDYLQIHDFRQQARSGSKFPEPCKAVAKQLLSSCEAVAQPSRISYSESYSVIRSSEEGQDEKRAAREMVLAAFHGWFTSYPKPVRETAARESWRRLVDSGEINERTLPDVIAGTKRWESSKEWTKDDGQWIPDASTFLTGNDKHGGRLWKERPPQIPGARKRPSSEGVDPNAEWVEPEEYKQFRSGK